MLHIVVVVTLQHSTSTGYAFLDEECPVAYNDATMRIGLLADTHIPKDAKMLPPHVKVALDGVDLIFHAGDIYLSTVLDELEAIAPVIAARGNGDTELSGDHRVKDSHVLDVAGFKVGLIHDFDPELEDTSRPINNAIRDHTGQRHQCGRKPFH